MKALSEVNIKSLYSAHCANMETYIMFRIAQRVVELTPSLTAKSRAPIKMSIGAPTVAPPELLIERFTEYLKEPGIHSYSVPEGEKYFRDAVAERMKTRFGVTVDPKNEVCSLLGSKEGLAHLFHGIITPQSGPFDKEIILTPDPGYASYVDAIKVCGGLSYPTPLTRDNHYMPDFSKIMKELTNQGYNPNHVKALIINYPSNPIGAMAPFSYFKDVVAFAKEHNILLISDIAYADLQFSGEEPPHSILEVPGAKEIAIEFHSLSKPYAITGWRIGFAVGNAAAVDILNKVKSTVDSGLFKAMQKAAAFALTSPVCDQFIKDTVKIYEANQARMLRGFQSLGWPAEALQAPRATFYLWLPIPPRYSSCVKFADELLETSGIVTVPGTAFGKTGEGYVRLSLVNPVAELDAVIERMQADGFTYH
ncbi:MAG: aminotransferase class I/II-fold pyridoxal phosphate-dependent enzyme [Cyanobacteria bacterium]|nr:aminotransferase class I/II-fold pyridoxal phosphate-dependent enzyme [Cyanobacteriota bacterium]